MAVAHSPLLRRVRLLAAKIETTPGTAIAVADADAAFNVFDLEMKQAIAYTERQKQGGFAMLPSQPGGYQGRCTFKSHLYGGSATPAPASTFFPAVGLGVSVGTYLLDNKPPEAAGSTQKCLTLASYQGGRLKKLHGCMGNAKFIFPAGQLARAEYDFIGKWNAVTDVAALTPTYPTLTPLKVISSTLTIGAWAAKIAELSLDLGNQLYLREDTTDATGFSSACIGNRLVTGSMNPEASLLTVKDMYGEWLSATEATLTIKAVAGAASVTMVGTKLQFINPDEGERNGVEIDNIAFQLNNDDLQFTFA